MVKKIKLFKAIFFAIAGNMTFHYAKTPLSQIQFGIEESGIESGINQNSQAITAARLGHQWLRKQSLSRKRKQEERDRASQQKRALGEFIDNISDPKMRKILQNAKIQQKILSTKNTENLANTIGFEQEAIHTLNIGVTKDGEYHVLDDDKEIPEGVEIIYVIRSDGIYKFEGNELVKVESHDDDSEADDIDSESEED